jgi:UDP-N-acetylmuramate--alanine ligase
VGKVNNIEVVDDFAHNPDKIAAALTAARLRGQRLLVVFQPHGFGPTRFLRDDLVEAFATNLRPSDHLWLPEIYYAGGTVTQDISSRDIVQALTARGTQAEFVAERADIRDLLVAVAAPGDLILVMGARDPSLTDFCHQILTQLQARDQLPGPA